MRLNVLFITAWYPELTNPMHGVFVQEHAKAVQLYDDVKVIHIIESIYKFIPKWQFVIDNNEIITLNIPTYRLNISRPTYRSTVFIFYLIRTLQAFRNMYATGYRPDILHGHTFRAGFAAVILGKLYNLPVIITEHNTAFPRNLLSKNKIILARFAMQNANRVLVVSKYLQNSIEGYGIHANFEVCPNVVDTSIFYPPLQFHTNTTCKQLLFVNRFDPVKGVDDLLIALSSIISSRQDWRLNIIGDGPDRAKYEEKVKELGLQNQIIFHGYQSKSYIADYMRQSDIFLLTSHIETFSVVSAEALSCGLPVLSTRCGGPEEFITPDAGRLVPVNDPKSLASELVGMMDDLEIYDRYNIAKYASKIFSLKTVGFYLHKLYTTINE
jgi:glycosyltransferase involved in cell wall biosynthesis